MCVGAWFGELCSDNPKYFTQYLLDNTTLEITWIGKLCVKSTLPKHPHLHFAEKGSLRATYALLRSKFWIFCIFHQNDLTSLPIDGGAFLINLWHGIPIKSLGQNSIWDKQHPSYKGLRSFLERVYSYMMAGEKDWFPVSSDSMAMIMSKGFPAKFSQQKALKFGSPRNDFLINNQNNARLIQSLKLKYARLLGFPIDKKIILYLPTWRINDNNHIFCFYNLDRKTSRQISQILGESNSILIEKHHFHTYEHYEIPDLLVPSFFTIRPDALKFVDVQELLLITDILICDYSSAYLDFALLHRPIIHFTYDYANYIRNDSGLAYDLAEFGGGESVQSIDKLIYLIQKNLQNPDPATKTKTFDLLKYETGTACEKILQFMRQNS